MITRIAVTGPESTGKSMLAEQLAAHYRTVWVPEYARQYLELLGKPYEEHDILLIAQGQLLAETSLLAQADKYLFCDTELLVTKIWSEVKYNRCDPWILKTIETHTYDLYLLCDIDLPWQYDPLREHPDHRQFLFDLYQNELINRKFSFRVVRGAGSVRLENAIQIIESLFSGKYA
ncbi:MAG: ATP-binding protein [Bacteroidetes bacterium]|nr:ATP-binding protein [Bacteroidota bacterium]